MIAELHVATWGEAYAGLLPPDELNRRSVQTRLNQWTRILTDSSVNVVVADGLGFASFGPQRDPKLLNSVPNELYALYLLKKAHGTGVAREFFQVVTDKTKEPFHTCVLDENHRACAFYEKQGAQLFCTQDEMLGETLMRERIYVWNIDVHKIEIDIHSDQ